MGMFYRSIFDPDKAILMFEYVSPFFFSGMRFVKELSFRVDIFKFSLFERMNVKLALKILL